MHETRKPDHLEHQNLPPATHGKNSSLAKGPTTIQMMSFELLPKNPARILWGRNLDDRTALQLRKNDRKRARKQNIQYGLEEFPSASTVSKCMPQRPTCHPKLSQWVCRMFH